MNFELIKKDPFRLFFPLGILFLIVGVLIWVPRIWDAENYPVLLHRSLVMNGFVACFIGGFLFTAVPRFSQTEFASGIEIMGLLSLILLSVCAGHFEREDLVFLFSGLTGLFILIFLARRMPKRKANPPYSFVFLFAGLLLWIISGISSYFGGGEENAPILECLRAVVGGARRIGRALLLAVALSRRPRGGDRTRRRATLLAGLRDAEARRGVGAHHRGAARAPGRAGCLRAAAGGDPGRPRDTRC